jgi:S-adenosylmethionine decarboxylase
VDQGGVLACGTRGAGRATGQAGRDGQELALAEALGCTIRAQLNEPFQPHGATCVLILAESHITVSTWPEHQLAHIDVFTCRAIMEPGKAIQPVLDVLGGHVAHTRNVPRLSPAALDNTNLDKGLS